MNLLLCLLMCGRLSYYNPRYHPHPPRHRPRNTRAMTPATNNSYIINFDFGTHELKANADTSFYDSELNSPTRSKHHKVIKSITIPSMTPATNNSYIN